MISLIENIKARLFRVLAENDENYISGASLAKELLVSRNAIWKAVQSLRLEGYDISAVTNKGYRLNKSGDRLSEAAISGYIKTAGVFSVELLKSVASTNTVLCGMAAKGAPEGYVVVAEEQTAGRGRQGRSFHSPPDSGIYFSLLLRPGSKADDAALVTSAAAVATAQAIGQITGVEVGIKWVNDLFYKNKKVCGILTEATLDMESGMVESIVLGIGINITRPENGFPGLLENVATALIEKTEGKENIRCRLIAATLDNFWKYYLSLAQRGFLEEYRKRSIVLGRDIYVLSGEERIPAHALAIDEDCRLIVRYENGKKATLNSGEVRVRAVDN